MFSVHYRYSIPIIFVPNGCVQNSLSTYTSWLNYLSNYIASKYIYLLQVFLFCSFFFLSLLWQFFAFPTRLVGYVYLSVFKKLKHWEHPSCGFSLPHAGSIFIVVYASISLHLMPESLAARIFCHWFWERRLEGLGVCYFLFYFPVFSGAPFPSSHSSALYPMSLELLWFHASNPVYALERPVEILKLLITSYK